MSSQKGNVKRTRKQKFQNSFGFKNDLHDKSGKMQMIKGLSMEGLCQRCKEIIEWKIKYKKYKPLSQPASCVVCRNKTVKRAYYTVCQPCAEKNEVCAKCNSKKEIVLKNGLSEKEKLEQEQQLQFEMQQLKERQRRTVLRHVEKGGDLNLPAGASFSGNGFSDFDDNDDFNDDEDDEEEEEDDDDNECDTDLKTQACKDSAS